MLSTSSSPDTVLKHTTSRCPVCQAACPARVVSRWGRVYLQRTCATHGEFSACLASDERFYWLAQGKEENRECCPGSACCSADGAAAGTLGRNAAGHGTQPFEMLSTCLALIEIVHSCNLACPTCYADSPLGAGSKVNAVPLEDIKQRIQGVIDRKGGIEILQLSGGEPTLHPHLFELCAWIKEHPKIDFVLLNTNGVRLAKEQEFALRLSEVFGGSGVQIYLQFDGVQEQGQRTLRGADLRTLREEALAQCAAAGLPVTLAMTVTTENLPSLWEAVHFGLQREVVHGITFQPVFDSGRRAVPSAAARETQGTTHGSLQRQRHDRLNTADILKAVVGQSSGQLRVEDFTPLPCGDPNCATIGYLIRQGAHVWHVSDFMDFTRLQGFLQDKMHYTLEDLARCGCENTDLGELLKTLERTRSMAFRIMVKPFMDSWTWDEDRIDRCCTHVIRPDGKLDSFCRYYSTQASVV
ncbi:radical SAM protein [Roseimicrobium sp. ORNL1]|uniref:radical SAM protein n=1 Tax=Roseimicrobium sp. ORNL1 TaxID=2711231 RepID=UPI0013E1D840|nr:radical SAM protein [Roseimicrobium sp. ORNL1]QIF00706.1 radical SAM protein [Roseimicrobium sp. ORNL1]